ncbi:MAG: hypothetical protein DRO11_02360 [Methanobacteriota archaeon]|nr:MAG: hypothetical protein DRO11_02360 [Euryarchaeota archaeon]
MLANRNIHNRSKVAIIYHPDLKKYDFGVGHPLRGERFEGFYNFLRETEIANDPRVSFHTPEPAADKDLLRVHTQEYVDLVQTLESTGGYLSIDTPLLPGVSYGARLIVGSGILAAKLVMSKGFDTAITFGGLHHAGRSSGEGFCVFNDVAITAKYLIDEFGLERILIYDTDAHHGNGTMDIFYDDPRVLYVSVHEDPTMQYPGRGFVHEIGVGEGEGYTVNIPLPQYAGNNHYKHVIDTVFKPLAEQFRPQVVLRNGGADPHYADLLTHLGMDLQGLHTMASTIREIASKAGAKLIDMSASGYNPKVLFNGLLALVAGSCGFPMSVVDTSNQPPRVYRVDEEKIWARLGETIAQLKKLLGSHWDLP